MEKAAGKIHTSKSVGLGIKKCPRSNEPVPGLSHLAQIVRGRRWIDFTLHQRKLHVFSYCLLLLLYRAKMSGMLPWRLGLNTRHPTDSCGGRFGILDLCIVARRSSLPWGLQGRCIHYSYSLFNPTRCDNCFDLTNIIMVIHSSFEIRLSSKLLNTGHSIQRRCLAVFNWNIGHTLSFAHQIKITT